MALNDKESSTCNNMNSKKPEKDIGTERISKRLCYILRYGAIKEGLTVHEGGMSLLYNA